MAGRRKLGSASLKTGRLIWPCLAGERGPDGRGKWPYAVEKWQVVDSELVLTDSNEYAYNGNELVHDISQLKLKNIHTKPVYNMQESNERCIIQFLKDGNVCGTIEIHGDGFFMFDWNYRDKESVHYRCMIENGSEFLEKWL